MTIATARIEDRELVILTREAFDELMEQAGLLPSLPAADAEGNRPALATCSIIIARKIISRRIKAGLTQKELAKRAGVRLETVCRVESESSDPAARPSCASKLP